MTWQFVFFNASLARNIAMTFRKRHGAPERSWRVKRVFLRCQHLPNPTFGRKTTEKGQNGCFQELFFPLVTAVASGRVFSRHFLGPCALCVFFNFPRFCFQFLRDLIFFFVTRIFMHFSANCARIMRLFCGCFVAVHHRDEYLLA